MPSIFRKKIERWISALPTTGKETKRLDAGFIATPLGDMLAISDASHLHMLEFCDLGSLETRLKKLQHLTGAKIEPRGGAIFEQVQTQLSSYFLGKQAEFSVDFALNGSDFSQMVWRFLADIPAAMTCSYREQAQAIGRPKAYRAVARANSQNRIAIIVPCHRVIGSDGTLTGYAGGIERKQWLLAHERRHFSLNQ